MADNSNANEMYNQWVRQQPPSVIDYAQDREAIYDQWAQQTGRAPSAVRQELERQAEEQARIKDETDGVFNNFYNSFRRSGWTVFGGDIETPGHYLPGAVGDQLTEWGDAAIQNAEAIPDEAWEDKDTLERIASGIGSVGGSIAGSLPAMAALWGLGTAATAAATAAAPILGATAAGAAVLGGAARAASAISRAARAASAISRAARAAKAIPGAKYLPKMLSKEGMLQGLSEGIAETGNTIYEMRQEGRSEEEIDEAANKSLALNSGFGAITGAVVGGLVKSGMRGAAAKEAAEAVLRAGGSEAMARAAGEAAAEKVGRGILEKGAIGRAANAVREAAAQKGARGLAADLGAAAGTAALGTAGESIQEGAQYAIDKYAQGKPIDAEGVLQEMAAMAYAAPFFGALGAGGRAVNRYTSRAKAAARQKVEAEQKAAADAATQALNVDEAEARPAQEPQAAAEGAEAGLAAAEGQTPDAAAAPAATNAADAGFEKLKNAWKSELGPMDDPYLRGGLEDILGNSTQFPEHAGFFEQAGKALDGNATHEQLVDLLAEARARISEAPEGYEEAQEQAAAEQKAKEQGAEGQASAIPYQGDAKPAAPQPQGQAATQEQQPTAQQDFNGWLNGKMEEIRKAKALADEKEAGINKWYEQTKGFIARRAKEGTLVGTPQENMGRLDKELHSRRVKAISRLGDMKQEVMAALAEQGAHPSVIAETSRKIDAIIRPQAQRAAQEERIVMPAAPQPQGQAATQEQPPTAQRTGEESAQKRTGTQPLQPAAQPLQTAGQTPKANAPQQPPAAVDNEKILQKAKAERQARINKIWRDKRNELLEISADISEVRRKLPEPDTPYEKFNEEQRKMWNVLEWTLDSFQDKKEETLDILRKEGIKDTKRYEAAIDGIRNDSTPAIYREVQRILKGREKARQAQKAEEAEKDKPIRQAKARAARQAALNQGNKRVSAALLINKKVVYGQPAAERLIKMLEQDGIVEEKDDPKAVRKVLMDWKEAHAKGIVKASEAPKGILEEEKAEEKERALEQKAQKEAERAKQEAERQKRQAEKAKAEQEKREAEEAKKKQEEQKAKKEEPPASKQEEQEAQSQAQEEKPPVTDNAEEAKEQPKKRRGRPPRNKQGEAAASKEAAGEQPAAPKAESARTGEESARNTAEQAEAKPAAPRRSDEEVYAEAEQRVGEIYSDLEGGKMTRKKALARLEELLKGYKERGEISQLRAQIENDPFLEGGTIEQLFSGIEADPGADVVALVNKYTAGEESAPSTAEETEPENNPPQKEGAAKKTAEKAKPTRKTSRQEAAEREEKIKEAKEEADLADAVAEEEAAERPKYTKEYLRKNYGALFRDLGTSGQRTEYLRKHKDEIIDALLKFGSDNDSGLYRWQRTKGKTEYYIKAGGEYAKIDSIKAACIKKAFGVKIDEPTAEEQEKIKKQIQDKTSAARAKAGQRGAQNRWQRTQTLIEALLKGHISAIAKKGEPIWRQVIPREIHEELPKDTRAKYGSSISEEELQGYIKTLNTKFTIKTKMGVVIAEGTPLFDVLDKAVYGGLTSGNEAPIDAVFNNISKEAQDAATVYEQFLTDAYESQLAPLKESAITWRGRRAELRLRVAELYSGRTTEETLAIADLVCDYAAERGWKSVKVADQAAMDGLIKEAMESISEKDISERMAVLEESEGQNVPFEDALYKAIEERFPKLDKYEMQATKEVLYEYADEHSWGPEDLTEKKLRAAKRARQDEINRRVEDNAARAEENDAKRVEFEGKAYNRVWSFNFERAKTQDEMQALRELVLERILEEGQKRGALTDKNILAVAEKIENEDLTQRVNGNLDVEAEGKAGADEGSASEYEAAASLNEALRDAMRKYLPNRIAGSDEVLRRMADYAREQGWQESDLTEANLRNAWEAIKEGKTLYSVSTTKNGKVIKPHKDFEAWFTAGIKGYARTNGKINESVWRRAMGKIGALPEYLDFMWKTTQTVFSKLGRGCTNVAEKIAASVKEIVEKMGTFMVRRVIAKWDRDPQIGRIMGFVKNCILDYYPRQAPASVVESKQEGGPGNGNADMAQVYARRSAGGGNGIKVVPRSGKENLGREGGSLGQGGEDYRELPEGRSPDDALYGVRPNPGGTQRDQQGGGEGAANKEGGAGTAVDNGVPGADKIRRRADNENRAKPSETSAETPVQQEAGWKRVPLRGLKEVKRGDANNIKETCPDLMEGQVSSIATLEKWMYKKGRQAALCADQAGTGKTFVGSTMIKRSWAEGKRNILIVTPTSQIANQWEGTLERDFGFSIENDIRHDIANSQPTWGKINTVTYTSMRTNPYLIDLEHDWDLIVFDESHSIVAAEESGPNNASQNVANFRLLVGSTENIGEDEAFEAWWAKKQPDWAKREKEVKKRFDALDKAGGNLTLKAVKTTKDFKPYTTEKVMTADGKAYKTYLLQGVDAVINGYRKASTFQVRFADKAELEAFKALPTTQLLQELRKKINADHQALRMELRVSISKAKAEEKPKFQAYINKKNKPKVLFASATPLSYEENVHYMEGLAFKYADFADEKGGRLKSYKDMMEKFFHIGYQYDEELGGKPKFTFMTKQGFGGELWRAPDYKAIVKFHDILVKLGAMTDRALDLAVDYAREFLMVRCDVISSAEEVLDEMAARKNWDNGEGMTLRDFFASRMQEGAMGRALETAKAKATVELARRTLEKDPNGHVVIFHDYLNPANKDECVFDLDEAAMKELKNCGLEDAYKAFKASDLWARASKITNKADEGAISVFEQAFGPCLKINGAQSEAENRRAQEIFTDTGERGGKKQATAADYAKNKHYDRIVLVTMAKGKQGLNLQDVIGGANRTVFQLGLPIRPVDMAQSEARVRRTGAKSGSRFFYIMSDTKVEEEAYRVRASRRNKSSELFAQGVNGMPYDKIIDTLLRRAIDRGVITEENIRLLDGIEPRGGKAFDAVLREEELKNLGITGNNSYYSAEAGEAPAEAAVMDEQKEAALLEDAKEAFKAGAVDKVRDGVYLMQLKNGKAVWLDLTKGSAQAVKGMSAERRTQLLERAGEDPSAGPDESMRVAGWITFGELRPESGYEAADVVHLTEIAETGTLDHESMHFLFNVLMTPQEKLAMERHYMAKLKRQEGAEAFEATSVNARLLRCEEMMAEDYADFCESRRQPKSGIERLFERIKDWLADFAARFGITTPNGIYAAARSGRLFEREGGRAADATRRETAAERAAREGEEAFLGQIVQEERPEGGIRVRSQLMTAPDGRLDPECAAAMSAESTTRIEMDAKRAGLMDEGEELSVRYSVLSRLIDRKKKGGKEEEGYAPEVRRGRAEKMKKFFADIIMPLHSPSRIENEIFQKFVNIYSEAYRRQEHERDWGNKVLDRALSHIKTEEDLAKLNDVLIKGDEEAKVYNKEELRKMGCDDDVVASYYGIRSLLDTLWDKVENAYRGTKEYRTTLTGAALLKRAKEFGVERVKIRSVSEAEGGSEGSGLYVKLTGKTAVDPEKVYDVSYVKPKVFIERERVLDEEEVKHMKENPQMFKLVRLKPLEGAEGQGPDGQKMYTATVYSVKGYLGAGKLKGYIPHVFHHWAVYLTETDEDGNVVKEAPIPVDASFDTKNEAIDRARKYVAEMKAKGLSEEELEKLKDRLYIKPMEFDPSEIGMGKADGPSVCNIPMTEAQFAAARREIQKRFGATYREAASTVKAMGGRPASRGRFHPNIHRRKNVAGWDRDALMAVQRYVTSSTRYIGMQPAKAEAVPLYEREFHMSYNSDVSMSDKPIAWLAKRYISYCNGNPGALEILLNNWLNKSEWIQKHVSARWGERWAVGAANNVTTLVSQCLLGFLNASTAIVNLFQLTNTFALLGPKALAKGVAHTIRPSKKDALLGSEALAKGFAHMAKLNQTDKKVLAQSGVLENMGFGTTGFTADRSGRRSLEKRGGFGRIWAAYRRLAGQGMALFKASEQACRRVTVLAAYYDGIDNHGYTHEQAVEYARKINRQANFDYSAADTPLALQLMSGTFVGEMFGTFKKYPLKQLELMWQMLPVFGKGTAAQKARFWGMYFLMAGALGVPVIDWPDKLWEKMFGYRPTVYAKAWLFKEFGDNAFTRLILYGVGSLAGVDTSRRLGMQDALPDADSLMGYAFGVPGTKAVELVQAVCSGEPGLIVRAYSPSLGNLYDAIRGYRTNAKMQKTYDYGDSVSKRVLRALGFRPIQDAVDADMQTYAYMDKKESQEAKSALLNRLAAKQIKGERLTDDDRAEARKMKVTAKQLQNAREQMLRTAKQRAWHNMTKEQQKRLGANEAINPAKAG